VTQVSLPVPHIESISSLELPACLLLGKGARPSYALPRISDELPLWAYCPTTWLALRGTRVVCSRPTERARAHSHRGEAGTSGECWVSAVKTGLCQASPRGEIGYDARRVKEGGRGGDLRDDKSRMDAEEGADAGGGDDAAQDHDDAAQPQQEARAHEHLARPRQRQERRRSRRRWTEMSVRRSEDAGVGENLLLSVCECAYARVKMR